MNLFKTMQDCQYKGHPNAAIYWLPNQKNAFKLRVCDKTICEKLVQTELHPDK